MYACMYKFIRTMFAYMHVCILSQNESETTKRVSIKLGVFDRYFEQH